VAAVRLSYIIPVRNDAARLARCLASIRIATGDVASEVIVADNGSTDGSIDAARNAGAEVAVYPKLRVSAVRNAAAGLAHGDYLAFVDADHELAAGWAAAAVRVLDEQSSVGAVGAPYHAPANGTWVQRTYDRLRQHRPGRRQVDWLPSGNMVVRRSWFDRLGGFDTTLETCEDVDFCQRLNAAGAQLLVDDGMASVHFGDPSTLRALFLGELWRGRDNLRVSLRARPSLRSLPSIALPIVNLFAIAAVLLGLLTAALWPSSWWMILAGIVVLAMTTTVRAVALMSGRERGDRRPADAGQALAVAGVYDLARALALVARTGHDARRRA
jgi:GT2 family glycosyltransferase